ncbi:hypothetical protein Syn7502_02941 [Synechococcus sp. PCC 7502]|uniref:hypothetical protein n=1 Tax=Synechococcus sp. PCC 7502 TaxID=1173263 RepID=UPI00029FF145|nr:hypothetical protein [Synechococcus sp. PCC 7502]AFY74866.1 hypothetical protein Syn7502_02941 [Synechococcus sp. PCC 7502]
MSQSHQFLDNRKIVVYHINSKVPLRRSSDLEGTNISVINGNGVLNQVLKRIKEGDVEVLITIDIPRETVKLIEVAIDKSHHYILLIQHELKGHETRESFLTEIESKVLVAEGGTSYRINYSDEPVLSLDPGELERRKLKLDQTDNNN